jgi:hypothetical protein
MSSRTVRAITGTTQAFLRVRTLARFRAQLVDLVLGYQLVLVVGEDVVSMVTGSN